jgi:hypothetical protein
MIKSRTFIPILFACILGSAIVLTVTLISPPAPLPADAPATEFSAGRAMQNLEVIAQEPHPMGVSPANAGVRDYLLEEIRVMGLEPQVQDTFGVRVVSPGFVLGGFVENILVRLPGTNPEGAILMSSHYDTTPANPGAGDNASGVVTVLEILRALHAGSQLPQDVIFLFTDGEEPGTIGSHAFVAQHPWFADVKLVITWINLLGDRRSCSAPVPEPVPGVWRWHGAPPQIDRHISRFLSISSLQVKQILCLSVWQGYPVRIFSASTVTLRIIPWRICPMLSILVASNKSGAKSWR